jgi:TIR domain
VAQSPETRDVFLSHASEDKGEFVIPLARELTKRGISCWLDEAEIHWGDRITQKINAGLQSSRYVIVFLSPRFVGKGWPESELAAALNKENSEGQTVVLPLVIGNERIVLNHYPLLQGKLHLNWKEGKAGIVDRLSSLLARKPLFETSASQKNILSEIGGPALSDLLNVSTPEEAHSLSEACDGYALPAPRSSDPNEGMKARNQWIKERWKLAQRDPALAPLWDRLRERWLQLQSNIVQEVEAELPSDGRLEIVSLTDTKQAELDIKLRNISDDSIYVTAIKVLVLRECAFVFPILEPTAKYSVPIAMLKAGESKSLTVSHVIPPHGADRFLVALDTTRVLQIRLTLGYDRHWSISENFWFWDHSGHYRKSYAGGEC